MLVARVVAVATPILAISIEPTENRTRDADLVD
jgi:hypothetical protein